MIYLTGDIHGSIDISKLNTRQFTEQEYLTKNDYLIVCGDFGLVWDNSNEDLYWRKWLDEKPWTTLFLDGNHENFNLLDEFPEVDMFSGKAQKISDSIYHLMRGEVYLFGGKTFLTMGGAESHDKQCRTPGINWWAEEMPNDAEMQHALSRLMVWDNRVDYILTHCAPRELEAEIDQYPENQLTKFLQYLYENVQFGQWYCGHYHQDIDLRDNFHVLFDDILQIE